MDNVTANQTDWYNNENSTSVDDNFESLVRMHIGLISLISLTSFIGNGLILAVVISKRKGGISTTYYLFGTLAMFDILGTCYLFTDVLLNGDVLRFKPWLYFFGTTCLDLSSWTLVLISMERLASVVIPFQVKTFVTIKTVMTAEIVMASVIIVLHYFMIIHFEYNYDEMSFADTLYEYGRFQYACFLFLILTPFAVISVSSIIIGFKIRTSIGGNKPRINSVTRNLLAANVAYIITQFPSTIFSLTMNRRMFNTLFALTYVMLRDTVLPLYYCTELLRVSNNAINCLA